jgi:hypothetical protein
MAAKPTEVWKHVDVLRILSEAKDDGLLRCRAPEKIADWMVLHHYLEPFDDPREGIYLRLTSVGKTYLQERRDQLMPLLVWGVATRHLIRAGWIIDCQGCDSTDAFVFVSSRAEMEEVERRWLEKWQEADIERWLEVKTADGLRYADASEFHYRFPEDYPVGAKMALIQCRGCESYMGWDYLHSHPLLNGYTPYCEDCEYE